MARRSGRRALVLPRVLLEVRPHWWVLASVVVLNFDVGLPAVSGLARAVVERDPHRDRRPVAVVTGGAGFVGANLAARLDGEGLRLPGA
jgi:hypothetical protein